MQKAQGLNIKHLYAIGEDQQDSSENILPEVTVNKMNICDNRGWYQNRCQGCKEGDYP